MPRSNARSVFILADFVVRKPGRDDVELFRRDEKLEQPVNTNGPGDDGALQVKKGWESGRICNWQAKIIWDSWERETV